jgi:purine-binding chemotaxis protein CheW
MSASMNTSTSTRTIPASAPATGGDPLHRYVSFTVGLEEFGADIRWVQEIKVWDSVTRLPHTPKYVLGVLNLRGAIVPVLDLRVRFGLDRAPFEPTTVIIVVRVPGERGERTVGVVVDAVNEVHDIAQEHIQPPPPLSAGPTDQAFIKGIATLGDRMITLLNLEMLVNAAVG